MFALSQVRDRHSTRRVGSVLLLRLDQTNSKAGATRTLSDEAVYSRPTFLHGRLPLLT
jgi:hypothetical protein